MTTFFKYGYLFLFLMMWCLPALVMAQSEEDVVYFKDGSIIRGQIIERLDNLIKIKTVGRNVLAIDEGEVKRISHEKIVAENRYKTEGYVNLTGMGLLPGTDATTVRFQMVNGYQFGSRLLAGIGLGFTSYNDPLSLLPVFLAVRYKFRKANTTPFIFGRTGYNFSILADEDRELDSHRGGLFLNPGFGIEFHTSAGFGWYLTAGFSLDKSSFEQQRWDGRVVETAIDYRRVQFGFGLLF